MIHQLVRLIFLRPMLMKQIIHTVLLTLGFCSLQGAAIVPAAALSVATTPEQPKQPDSPYTLQAALTEPIAKEVQKATELPRELSRIIGSYIPSLPIELLPLCLGQHKPSQRSVDAQRLGQTFYSEPFSVSDGFYIAHWYKVLEYSEIDETYPLFLDIVYRDLHGCDTVRASINLEKLASCILQEETGDISRLLKYTMITFDKPAFHFERQRDDSHVTLYVAFSWLNLRARESDRRRVGLVAFDFDLREQNPNNCLRDCRMLFDVSERYIVRSQPRLAVGADGCSFDVSLWCPPSEQTRSTYKCVLPAGHTVTPYPTDNADGQTQLEEQLRSYFHKNIKSGSLNVHLDKVQMLHDAALVRVNFSLWRPNTDPKFNGYCPIDALFDATTGKVVFITTQINMSHCKKMVMHPSGLLCFVINYSDQPGSYGVDSEVVKAIMQRPEQVAILRALLTKYHATVGQPWTPSKEEDAQLQKLDPIVKGAFDAYRAGRPWHNNVSYVALCDAVGNLVRSGRRSIGPESRQLIVPLVNDTVMEPRQPLATAAEFNDEVDRRTRRRKMYAAVAVGCAAAVGGYRLFQKWRAKQKLPIVVPVR